jgi:hypothetical protein
VHSAGALRIVTVILDATQGGRDECDRGPQQRRGWDGERWESRHEAPDHTSYSSFASFGDPDGNSWLFQEVTTRLPGRVDPAATSFGSVSDLANAMRRASAAARAREAHRRRRPELA